MRQLSFVVFLVAALAACGDNRDGYPDAHPRPDAAGDDDIDAAGDDDIDAALPPDANVDAALPPDANVDAEPMTDVSAQIAAVRAAADGAVDLPIEGAMVTFLKPFVASGDPAGFTIQGSQAGPAIFVTVDPATLTPVPAIGDTVTFTVTMKGTTGGMPRVTAITGFTVDATGGSVAGLVKNISAATDLVTAGADYDQELIDISGTITDAFAGSGTGFQRALFTTTGFPTADPQLQFRVPTTLRDGLDMVVGCSFALDNTPVGIFINGAGTSQTQVAAFTASDVTLTNCPAPTVTNAVALSSTSVRVSFDRNILASSVMADGSQFTFTGGLTASAAVVSGRDVTLTTSTQTGLAMYVVTVANTVTDLSGAAIGTPDTAMFGGFATAAVVRINEVNANVTNGCDLIELRVVTGGVVTGFVLRERTGASGHLNLTFPAISVATNDFIVVHLNSASTSCNPNTATQETASPNEQPAASFAGNFDTAYDLWNSDTGLTNTDNVFTLFDAATTIVDAVFVSDDPAGLTAAADTETAAATVGVASQWDPAMTTYIDTVFRTNAVDDLNGTGSASTGTSIQRLDNTDDNNVADWTTGAGAASTWGALNAGQTAF